MKKLILIALALQLSIPPAWAEDNLPLVRLPTISQTEFEAYANAHDLTTFAESLDLARPGEPHDEQLKTAIERAQSAWLSGDVENAQTAFKQIAAQSQTADWRDSQREAIQFSMMRLAQTASSPVERESWLNQAIRLFPDLVPDTSLFPPPLMDFYFQRKQELMKSGRSIRLAEKFPAARFVILNGRRYEIAKNPAPKIFSDVVRVTLLSDFAAPVTKIMKTSELASWKPQLKPLVSGSCEKPEFDYAKESFAVYFHKGCLRERKQNTWVLPQNKRDESSLFTIESNRESATPLPSLPGPSTESSWKSNKWLWIGVGVLAVGLGAAALQSSQKEVAPTNRSGF